MHNLLKQLTRIPKLFLRHPIISVFISSIIILLIELQQGIFVKKIFSNYQEDVILSDDIINRRFQYPSNSTKIASSSGTRVDNSGINHNTIKISDNSIAPKEDKNILNFYTNPTSFIQTLSTCFLTKTCHVIYHHIGKTGGTNVESRFFGTFPFHPNKPKMSSCCSNKVMEPFKKYTKFYCAAKFTAYQVRASQFDTVVSSCMEYYQTLEEKGHSIVILVSIREPASRTLSNIHQLCNKNLNRRSEELKQACVACNYETHPAEFDKIVQTTNKDYLGIIRTTQLANKFDGVKSLTFDTDDIDRMFIMLQVSLGGNYVFPMNEKTNPEKHSRCNFGWRSGMFRDLAVSREIYRNVTSGQVY